jgi:hypothetical protein
MPAGEHRHPLAWRRVEQNWRDRAQVGAQDLPSS